MKLGIFPNKVPSEALPVFPGVDQRRELQVSRRAA